MKKLLIGAVGLLALSSCRAGGNGVDSASLTTSNLTAESISSSLGFTPTNKSGDTMTGALNLPTDGLTVGSTELVTNGGNVGIGTASPKTTLDVNGGIKVGNLGSALCTPALDGTIQYISGSDIYQQCFGALSTWMVLEPQSAWQTIAGNTTAIAGGRYAVNTTGGVVTLTLPASPATGNRITVLDYNGSFATNNLVVGANGKNIMGLAQDMTVPVNNITFELVYIDGTVGWRLK